ncbi:hypothetical protein SeMB42_g05725 [Synchytrium endobioticum]|uniref:Uncharacterized protein n=1 Tax=Synchytrium endobioticum TaxID=286115 RepID=A0A507D724_9FUNG|nr:hypothetical protein SeMB42_g05725 [Synchytrium endobioticum]TPX47155.1 hypothetical protein SeLEV6574_g02821 [Synchytrium endobioticum]
MDSGTFASTVASGPAPTPSHAPEAPDSALGSSTGAKVQEDTPLKTQQRLEELEQREKAIQLQIDQKLHDVAFLKNDKSKPQPPVQMVDLPQPHPKQ